MLAARLFLQFVVFAVHSDLQLVQSQMPRESQNPRQNLKTTTKRPGSASYTAFAPHLMHSNAQDLNLVDAPTSFFEKARDSDGPCRETANGERHHFV